MAESSRVEVFFDGDCPLCVKEIRMLQWMDKKKQRICFTDIAAPDFDAEALGTTYDDLMSRIQGRLPDGTWIEGVGMMPRSLMREAGGRMRLDCGWRDS